MLCYVIISEFSHHLTEGSYWSRSAEMEELTGPDKWTIKLVYWGLWQGNGIRQNTCLEYQNLTRQFKVSQEICWTDSAWKADDILVTADLVAYQQPKTWKYGKMRPEHFGKRNLCIYNSKAIICFFSAKIIWSNLWSKRKRPEVLQGVKYGSFQQPVPGSQGAAWLVVPTVTPATDSKCHHYPATSAVSQVATWQWEVAIFKVSLSSVLQPHCKMFDSFFFLSNFLLQKKKMCYQPSALPCTISWDRRDASANAWADVKALLKKWVLMRIWFQFWDK